MGFIALPQAPRSRVPAPQKKLLKSRKTQLLPWIAAALVMLKEERVLLGHLLLRRGCAGMLPCLPPSSRPPIHPLIRSVWTKFKGNLFCWEKKKKKNQTQHVVASKSKHFTKPSVDETDIIN